MRLFGGDIQRDLKVIDARDTGVTTCDFPNPHYVFRAKSTTIVPGKHLIARKVSLYRRNKKIATIPYVLLPLNDRYTRQGITPQVGQSPEEGYFAKFALPYALTAAAIGILRMDLIQRKGVGLGFDQGYTVHNAPSSGAGGLLSVPLGVAAASPGALLLSGAGGGLASGGLLGGGRGTQAGSGTFKFYELNDRQRGLNELTGSLTHDQFLFRDIRLTIQSQFQSNSYLSRIGSSGTTNSQVTLARDVRGMSTSLLTNIQESSYGFSQSRTINTSFQQAQTLSSISRYTFKVGLGQFAAPGVGAAIPGTKRQTLTTDFDFVSQPKGYKYEFLTDTFQATQSGSASGVLTGGVERLPEFRFETVPGFGQRLVPALLPALSRFLLSLGDFREKAINQQTSRLQMGLDLGSNTRIHRALTNTYAGSFNQAFYGDNTARYTLQTQLGTQYAFQKTSTLAFNYQYLRPYGYTPFLFDRSGSYNTAGATLGYAPNKRVQLNLTSGFDFQRDRIQNNQPAAPWQNVSGQLLLRPTNTFVNTTTAAYDPNKGQLFNLADQLQIGAPGGFLFQASAQYAPVQKTFSTINGNLDLPIIVDAREQAGYRIRALAGYNGFTKQFTYKGFALTRSWHDWELSGIYQENAQGIQTGGTFYLNFRLKAFPGYEPFAVGSFGQSLDTSIGQVY